MKTIEYFVNRLKNVQTQSDFNRFIAAIGSNDSFLWAGMVTYKIESPSQTNVSMQGEVPDAFACWLKNSSELMRLSRSNVVPQCVASDDLEGVSSEHDLGGLLLVPYAGLNTEHGFLIFALDKQTFNDSGEKLERLGWFWSIIVPYVYEAHCRVYADETANITKREMECICWASEGKTSWEISKILDISERTVNFHLANCIQKTGSVNRQQAIAKCLLQGQLMSA